jgi:hypothetical protein
VARRLIRRAAGKLPKQQRVSRRRSKAEHQSFAAPPPSNRWMVLVSV